MHLPKTRTQMALHQEAFETGNIRTYSDFVVFVLQKYDSDTLCNNFVALGKDNRSASSFDVVKSALFKDFKNAETFMRADIRAVSDFYLAISYLCFVDEALRPQRERAYICNFANWTESALSQALVYCANHSAHAPIESCEPFEKIMRCTVFTFTSKCPNVTVNDTLELMISPALECFPGWKSYRGLCYLEKSLEIEGVPFFSHDDAESYCKAEHPDAYVPKIECKSDIERLHEFVNQEHKTRLEKSSNVLKKVYFTVSHEASMFNDTNRAFAQNKDSDICAWSGYVRSMGLTSRVEQPVACHDRFHPQSLSFHLLCQLPPLLIDYTCNDLGAWVTEQFNAALDASTRSNLDRQLLCERQIAAGRRDYALWRMYCQLTGGLNAKAVECLNPVFDALKIMQAQANTKLTQSHQTTVPQPIKEPRDDTTLIWLTSLILFCTLFGFLIVAFSVTAVLIRRETVRVTSQAPMNKKACKWTATSTTQSSTKNSEGGSLKSTKN